MRARVTRSGVVRVAAHLAAIAIAAFAVSRVLAPASTGDVNFIVWIVGGALLHDLVLLPLYSLSDLVMRLVIADHPLRRRPAVNYLRAPALISLVLLLVYAPTILDRNPGNFERVSGRPQPTDPLAAWLWITLALFAIAALVAGANALRDRRRDMDH